jgi:hypothetical protein
MNNYPLFFKSKLFSAIEASKPMPPQPPKQPQSPKLVKKNWFEKIFLFVDEQDDKIINANRMKKYSEQLAKYDLDLIEYKKQVNILLAETNIKIFRNEQKKDILSKTIYADLSTRETLKGRYESFFLNHLSSKFSSKIFNNLEFQLPNSYAFVPDFSYVDKSIGLCIDIEIDEPYTSDNKTPIHCIGDDDYRNNYFLSKGWFVVRFAEVQIAKYPKQCCDFIASIIEHITTGKDIDNFILPIKTWNSYEASEMAKNNFRNTY